METTVSFRTYLFRGDDDYDDDPIGLAFGADADGADIQNFSEHVLRKESRFSSRYSSFTEDLKVARRFTSATDNRHVIKVEVARLRELEAQGTIKIWSPNQVYEALRAGLRKLAKQAADVRTAMSRNGEILIEGQISAEIIEKAS